MTKLNTHAHYFEIIDLLKIKHAIMPHEAIGCSSG